MRWQYQVVNVGTIDAARRLGMTLSYFGQHGWELVGVYDKSSNWIAGMEKGFMLFKRPVPDGQEPDGPWTGVWTAEQVEAAYTTVTSPGS